MDFISVFIFKILFFILLPLSFFKKNYIVIGSKSGRVGNAYALYTQLKNADNFSSRIIWIDDINDGSVYYVTFKKFTTLLFSSHVIYTHSQRDIFFATSLLSTRVNIWHGSPIKYILNDNHKEATLKNKLIWMLKNNDPRKSDYFVVGGERFVDIIESATGLSRDKLVVCGNPSNNNALYENFSKGSKYVIYFPTFRDDDSILSDDFLLGLRDDWKELYDQRQTSLLIKPHPNEDSRKINYSFNNEWFTILDSNIEQYCLLSNCEAMISDYSSIIFDSTTFGKRAYIMKSQLDDCKSERGGAYLSIENLSEIPNVVVVECFSEVIDELMCDNSMQNINYKLTHSCFAVPFNLDIFISKVGL
tara:strand:- start:2914 stop:3996 length:1083 start_codon:yes stop_codon:yes gene_type:complete